MANLYNQAKRAYWSAKVRKVQDQARIAADRLVGPMPWTAYATEWRRAYRAELRARMKGVKL